MVSALDRRKYRYVADFAAGDGALLRAARESSVDSTFIATDACSKIVASLRKREPSWQVGRCNFLNPLSRAQCRAINGLTGKISLILLNPPFSCRGGAAWPIKVGGNLVRCSLALAFLLSALDFLASDGELIAVLPAGSPESEKDRRAWQHIRSRGVVELLGTNGLRTFTGCFAKTVLVRFRQAGNANFQTLPGATRARRQLSSRGVAVTVSRGRVQMPSMTPADAGDGLPFVHSTELHSDGLDLLHRRIARVSNCITGPAVLVHRVGQPSKSKIALYLSKAPIVLSDCVIALRVGTTRHAKILQTKLLRSWDLWRARYSGTCAPYVTIERIKTVLRDLGFSPNCDQDKNT